MTPARSSSVQSANRIVGNPVPALVPAVGPVHVLLVGEAPGPRGADKSGYPFFGDLAGKHLYRVLLRLRAVAIPGDFESLPWDGATFAGYRPQEFAKPDSVNADHLGWLVKYQVLGTTYQQIANQVAKSQKRSPSGPICRSKPRPITRCPNCVQWFSHSPGTRRTK